MIVLSLFDGISCGRVALERANIKIDKYYASEINKYAIQIALKNYPDTIQLGDVTRWKEWKIDQPDIIIGGPPCTGFSVAGKGLNFKDPQSKLFFEYYDILKHYKPKYFLLENVPMLIEHENIISKMLYSLYPSQKKTFFPTDKLKPLRINSALVSAQNRQRLYWTNIPARGLPKDKGILLKDIILTGKTDRDKSYCIDASYYKGGNEESYFNKCRRQQIFEEKENTVIDNLSIDSEKSESFIKVEGHNSENGLICVGGLDKNKKWVDDGKNLQRNFSQGERVYSVMNSEIEKGKVGYIGNTDSQGGRIYSIHGKGVTLCGEGGGGGAKMGIYLFGCLTPDRLEKRQNGQRVNDGNKFFTLTSQDKHGILKDGYIRKLHPRECEKLQTLPDNFTEGISFTQRYKCLGNGWTVDVVAWIFGFLPGVGTRKPNALALGSSPEEYKNKENTNA